MNINIKKLISYVRLHDDCSQVVNTVIGYLNSFDKLNEDRVHWSYIISKLIDLDLTTIKLVNLDLEDVNSINRLKGYGCLFNNCYNFINDEGYIIPFIKEAPFNNVRVASISDYSIYILARRTHLNEYEEYKNRGK